MPVQQATRPAPTGTTSAPVAARHYGGGTGSVRALLPAAEYPGNQPFLFFHYPHQWDFCDETGEFLPRLVKLPEDPGVGGVREGGDPSLAIGQKVRQGGILIPPGDPRLGSFAGYCVGHENSQGKRHFVEKHTTLRMVGRRAFLNPGEGNGYRDFQRHLVTCGLIPAIDPAVREYAIDEMRERLDGTKGRLGSNPTNTALADRVQSLADRVGAAERGMPVADFTAERESAGAGEDSAPPRRRRRASKGPADG